MAPLGPFGPGRAVVAGVSGGADSMALAILLQAWGDPLAVIVDHGLRPGSTAEATQVAARLHARGIAARIVRLHGLHRGPDLGARARTARYDALLAECRQTGRPDLLIGHHAQDQVETILLRTAAGSGPMGRAGMAPIAWRNQARILRPLLAIPPARLRATLHAAGVDWIEDPTNHDPATARGALRQQPTPMANPTAAAARAAAESAVAHELARHVTLAAGGWARLDGPLSPAAWSALVWTLSGQPYPPSPAGSARLARTGQGTLHGIQAQAGFVVREAAATAPPVPANPGARWDNRFLVHGAPHGTTIGALGAEAVRLRQRPGPPSRVMQALPALRAGSELLVVPHLAYPDIETCLSVDIEFCPARPLAGLPFAAAAFGGDGPGDAHGADAPHVF